VTLFGKIHGNNEIRRMYSLFIVNPNEKEGFIHCSLLILMISGFVMFKRREKYNFHDLSPFKAVLLLLFYA